ncbi:glycosyltransferase family 39 protein [Galbitalea soli]|uniref:Glycosyltransferase family 39 protein n=1 Tax=Galbitalea soli TaxID=1268042 RepID=A0A7C9PN33_9MICO|nr:glycosyltransferase family 39 protein [Galbitalea soli]NEM91247.1 glycosyltransferase family 39 protein [Galbitalea soli]NYJ29936.1 4-amino-4-deoxy-L-arabinose transferase-like glycosyltransferase [Galbitalea soli]
MSLSDRALLFGTFDPTATITLDKLSGFLVPQALAVRAFGFSQWALALPQVVEGLVTVAVVFAIARRWRGPRTGLFAAAAFATTPLLASVFGHVMEDALVTMCLACAVLAWQRAVASARILPLVVSGSWVAIGFQAKMLQAWFVMPALVVGLLLVPSLGRAARWGRAGVLVAVSVVGSVAWMTVLQLLPPSGRPYIDGSTSNNIFATVFGYNGVNRFVPHLVPGAVADFVSTVTTVGASGSSPLKLLLPQVTTQVGWLYPLAGAGVLAIALTIRRRADRALGVAMVLWLATAALVISASTVPHAAYYAALSVPLSLLAAVGCSAAVRACRSGAPGLARLALPALVGAQAAWTLVILGATGIAPLWLGIAVAVLGGAAVIVAVARRRGAVILAVASMLLAPAAWTASELDPSLAGSANDAYGGPRLESVGFFFRATGSLVDTNTFDHFAIAPPVLWSPPRALTVERRALAGYVRAHRPAGGVLFVADSWESAAPYILDAGLPVEALGGFSGAAPSPTLARVRSGVAAGALRFFLLPTQVPPPHAHPTERERILDWVTRSCTWIPDDAYEGATTLVRQSLWDCSPGAPR